MSRGGGGGRGGGRGGRGGRGGAGGRSMTQDLIRDNMEDLGLDSFQLVDDRIPPPLYPDTHIPVPNPLTDEDSFAVQKMREISHRSLIFHYTAIRSCYLRLIFCVRIHPKTADVTLLPDAQGGTERHRSLYRPL